MKAEEQENYKQYVSLKLNELKPIFANAAIRGEFSDNVNIPEEDDEFADLFVGIQIMLEVIREQLTELKESTSYYSSIIESIHDGILIEEAGIVVYVNKSFARIFGYENAGEIIGMKIAQFNLLHFFSEKSGRPGKTIPENTKINNYEYKAKDKKDNLIELEASQAEWTLLGKQGIVTVMRDVSERKKMQYILHENEEKYRVLAETATDAIVSINEESKILYANSAFEHIFGYKTSEIIGEKLTRFISGNLKVLFLNKHKEHFNKEELTGLHKSGIEIPLEISFGEYIKDGASNFTVIIRDITIRKRTENLLNGQKNIMEMIGKGESLNNILISLAKFVEKNNREIFCSITLLDKDGIHLRKGAAPSLPESFSDAVDGLVIGPDKGSCGTAAFKAEQIISIDIETDPIWKDYKDWIISNYGLKSAWSTPIFSAERKVLGTFAMYSKSPRVPSQIDQELIQVSTRIAGIAIERMQADKQLRQSLDEKEVLLKEIHHRVKNNIQIIRSLLSLQSKFLKDKQAIDIITESINRITSISIIHELLYQSKDLSKIEFTQHIRQLVVHLFNMYGINPSKLKVEVNVDKIALGIDTAVPCGLLVNELLTNAFKYAFPDNREGKIIIDMHLNDNKITLIVSDDGVGISHEKDIDNQPHMGMQLIRTLTRQLDGNLDIENHEGTKFTINFPLITYKERI